MTWYSIQASSTLPVEFKLKLKGTGWSSYACNFMKKLMRRRATWKSLCEEELHEVEVTKIEVTKMWKIKTKTSPVVIGALGMIKKGI